MPPLDTMEILGHARIAVTMEIYTSADETSRPEKGALVLVFAKLMP